MNFISNIIRTFEKTIIVPKIIILNSQKVVENGRDIHYYYNNKEKIGYIRYKYNGQIGLLYLEPEYRGFGIGKIMVDNAIHDMKHHDVPEAWLVTIPDHKFWKQIGFTWREKPVHPSVTGSGFYKKID
jgi:N-acetylglutamate synthase-like GNAT family acetyltransferase